MYVPYKYWIQLYKKLNVCNIIKVSASSFQPFANMAVEWVAAFMHTSGQFCDDNCHLLLQ